MTELRFSTPKFHQGLPSSANQDEFRVDGSRAGLEDYLVCDEVFVGQVVRDLGLMNLAFDILGEHWVKRHTLEVKCQVFDLRFDLEVGGQFYLHLGSKDKHILHPWSPLPGGTDRDFCYSRSSFPGPHWARAKDSYTTDIVLHFKRVKTGLVDCWRIVLDIEVDAGLVHEGIIFDKIHSWSGYVMIHQNEHIALVQGDGEIDTGGPFDSFGPLAVVPQVYESEPRNDANVMVGGTEGLER